MILESATTRSKRYAQQSKEMVVGNLDMISSIIYVCPYEFEDNNAYDFPRKNTPVTLNAIINVTREIYHKNGFTNIVVNTISRKEAEKLVLNPQDTIITILGAAYSGMDSGKTPASRLDYPNGISPLDLKFHNINGGYDLSMCYISVDSYLLKNTDDKINAEPNLLCGYALAHEILHQYLIKANLFLSDTTGYAHYDNLANLNMEYKKSKEHLQNKRAVVVNKTVPGIFNIWQKAELRTYFKLISNGVGEYGLSKNKTDTLIFFNREMIKYFEELIRNK